MHKEEAVLERTTKMAFTEETKWYNSGNEGDYYGQYGDDLYGYYMGDNDTHLIDYPSETVSFIPTFVPLVFSIIVILGCVGNTIVLIVVIRNRDHFRNTTNLFILNLSVADLLFLLFCVPFHTVIYATGNWPFGNFMCKFVHFIQFLSMVGSVFTLVAMAGDRYLAVAHALETKHLRTPSVAFVACVILWIVAFAIALPMPIVYSVQYYPDNGITMCADAWSHRNYRKIYFLFLFIFGFLLPLIAIFFLSVFIVRQLWLTQQPEGPRMRESIVRKRKVTRLIIVVVVVFCICWLPMHVLWIWFNFGPTISLQMQKHLISARLAAHGFSYANSMLNPVLYAFLSANFRRAFQKAILCRNVEPTFLQKYTFTKMPNSQNSNVSMCRRGNHQNCAHFVIQSNSSDACL